MEKKKIDRETRDRVFELVKIYENDLYTFKTTKFSKTMDKEKSSIIKNIKKELQKARRILDETESSL